MKKKQTFWTVCLIATVLLINVYMFEWLFVPLEPQIKTLIWLFDGFIIALLLIMYRWERLRNSSWFINLFASFFFSVLLFYLFVSIDRLLISRIQVGLIFPANTEVVYEGNEFHVSAKINSLGFRDYEFAKEKQTDSRILAFGDSYTFGWGVDVDSCWVKLTEAALQEKGHRVEFLNLGQPGKFSKDYADHAAIAIPFLKPDIVVIAILQGNDLYQAINHLSPKAGRFSKKVKKQSLADLAQLILSTFFPNTQKLLVDRAAPKTQHIKETWKAQVKEIITDLNEQEREYLEKIDPTIRKAAEQGLISPSIINRSIRHHDMYMQLDDSSSDPFHLGIKQITSDFERIKDIADEYGTEVLVISVPSQLYTTQKAIDFAVNKLGMDMPTNILENNTSNTAFALASQQAGLEFFDNTKPFILAADTSDLYYKIDGHFNVGGNMLFSTYVSNILEQKLAR